MGINFVQTQTTDTLLAQNQGGKASTYNLLPENIYGHIQV